MIRAVLDTNVIVSAILTPHGTCDRIIRLASHDVFALCVDERILAEYREVLHRPGFGPSAEVVNEFLAFAENNSFITAPLPLALDLPHPDDAPFVEVAKAAGASLVTGNLRHYPAVVRRVVGVVTPRQFLTQLET